ncbi:zinc finger protein CTH1 (macronuclear) [Tetrahymena thermophila SB210]|uniref:Zinc finger protein CTH1 n=1 Tax=Tetrahymena thermophila (strain SB210) TaxID=312017 RepID=I7MGC8_TETTS|nr:zinc finger protein CTH1 [Tetrahymena thermophila SB210]EAS01338.1 zinc finger protein CTH1 [Tetrahymena thermophila SB210]|eukprot:XP_001021583.1 zinc finger protein CTH1 [Tetrahymena thermophila SB210]
MIKNYQYDNYLIDSAAAQKDLHIQKQNHKQSTSSNHPQESYSTATSSDSDGENNQNLSQNQQESSSTTEPQNLIQKERYKTELCRNYQIHGTCNYGKKCQYAHGRHELQQKPERKTNQYYKTRPCKEFFNTLTCPYGQRCKYNHDTRSINEIIKPSTFYQKKLLTISTPQASKQNTSSSTSSRLLFFQQNFNKNNVDNQIEIQAKQLTAPYSTLQLQQKENNFFRNPFQQEIVYNQIPIANSLTFNEPNTYNKNQDFNQKNLLPTLDSSFLSSSYFFQW